jgi:hypothetical protein
MGRDLLTPPEVGRLPKTRCIVITDSCRRPIMAKKKPWYDDAGFRARVRPPRLPLTVKNRELEKFVPDNLPGTSTDMSALTFAASSGAVADRIRAFAERAETHVREASRSARPEGAPRRTYREAPPARSAPVRVPVNVPAATSTASDSKAQPVAPSTTSGGESTPSTAAPGAPPVPRSTGPSRNFVAPVPKRK